jgi:hypothetical protein
MSNPETVGDIGGDETTSISNGGTVLTDDKKVAATASNNRSTTPSNGVNGHCNAKEITSSIPMLNGSSKSDIKIPEGTEDDEYIVEEAVVEEDEEENLLMSLEEKAEQDADHEIHQPNAVEEAPRLLQAALKDGQVKADESEEEEDNVAHAAVAASPEVHVHKRVRRTMSLVFVSKYLPSQSLGMVPNDFIDFFLFSRIIYYRETN